jgi:hypothetical protein
MRIGDCGLRKGHVVKKRTLNPQVPKPEIGNPQSAIRNPQWGL